MPIDDPKVVAAIIAGLVAAGGVLASVLSSRWQFKLKAKEFSLASEGHKHQLERLNQEIEALKQNQLTEVLKKRLETYPGLWEATVKYGQNWTISRKPRDSKWAKEFLDSINDHNERNGVYYSEPVYASFHDLRNLLMQLEYKLSHGKVVSQEEYNRLDEILLGRVGAPGLGTCMKNDLGSYERTSLSKRADEQMLNNSVERDASR